MRPKRHSPGAVPLVLAAALSAAAGTGRAQPMPNGGGGSGSGTAAYLAMPPGGGEAARCDWFARLKRFTDETKRDCDDGRAVKPGPITTSILDRCRTEQGPAFGTKPIDDLLDGFARQAQRDGLGNACHEIKQQAWDLVAQ